MISIQFPEPVFRTKKEANKDFVFDDLRKKWLLLTPEEWVRQNFIQYLIQVKKYPATLIALEKEIQLGELKKRFDVLIYNKDHQPWMMIECKAPEIKLDDAVLQQVLRYNISVPVEFMIITNGNNTYGWKRSGNDLVLVDELPDLL
ncbi:MAG: type I restriction enzyme HsdR N-terminal domain-containing protein [Bacteroidota bacterium]